MKNLFILLMAFCLQIICHNTQAQSNPKYWQYAPNPVLGWNSWDIFGTTVTEQQAKEQADAMSSTCCPVAINILQLIYSGMNPIQRGIHIKKVPSLLWMNMDASHPA